MAKSRSARKRAALLRAGFSPEPNTPQRPLTPIVVAEPVLEPEEVYVEVPRTPSPSSEALEIISDVSVSPSTPAISLFSSSAFSTPKVSPTGLVSDDDMSADVVLPPTYNPAASTFQIPGPRAESAPPHPKPIELVFGPSLSGSYADGGSMEEKLDVVRHPKYSFPDGSLNCQVENTLFSVHEHIRGLSPALADLLPVDRASCTNGAHFPRIHRSPRVQLHGIKATEFEALLDMIYTPIYAAKNLNQATYALALPLCIKWGLEDLQKFILAELERTMSVVDLLSVAQEHSMPELVESCFKILITRPKRLTMEEGRKLGVESTIFISGLREEARTRNMCLHTCIACDSKPRVNGQNLDLGFVERQVKEWVNFDK